MRCQKLRSLLPAYCNGELESSKLSAIERHFHTCPSCRQDLSAHRLISGGVASLRQTAPDITHFVQTTLEQTTLEQTTSSMEAPVNPMYRVSEGFNTRLLDRIADERYAEVRSRAHLPKKAPLFIWTQFAPAAVIAAALALVVVGLAPDKAADSLQPARSSSKALVSAPASITASADFDTPPLGERLGLNEKYMTAQPVNNPTFAGASPARVSEGAAPAYGAALVSSQPGAIVRWQFTRQIERARRIMEISNSLGMGHTYFEIIQYRNPLSSGVMVVRVNPYHYTSRQRQLQIILRPNLLREYDGRTPAGRLVGGSF